MSDFDHPSLTALDDDLPPGRAFVVLDATPCKDDPDLFFPSKGESTSPAKRLCQICPARQACADWALDNDERFGIWGGLSPEERYQLKRRGTA